MLGVQAKQEFLGRVAAVAEELGIGFPLQEGELTVRRLTFVNPMLERYPWDAPHESREARAVVQLLARDSHELNLDDEWVREKIEEVFGPFTSSEHHFIELLRPAEKILVIFKK
ncbi:hypothetical protein KKD81_03425 [Patescibacteria group bacterium]|nr:hypothetical protein [Patescibacteria group bacterium]MBU2159201.1 hypothetical protein [Patescibacteria group bacterium]MBU2220956.1 hypothetical protein [Patescibacteria group bacterium]